MQLKDLDRTPIKFSRATSLSSRNKAELLVVPFVCEKKQAKRICILEKLENKIKSPIKLKDFTGKSEESLCLYVTGEKEERILLLGLGEAKEITKEVLRRCFSQVVRVANKKKLTKMNIFLPSLQNIPKEEIVEGVAEGLLLTDYVFDVYKTCSKEQSKTMDCCFIGATKEELSFVKRLSNTAQGTYLARDLVNRNADEVNPETLVSLAKEMGKKSSALKTIILGEKELEKQKLGLLLAVNRASSYKPALIICQYKGDPSTKEHTVVVGKGVTYDTGGLNLKSNMLTMKSDMGGAAACFGLLYAMLLNKLPTNVTIVVPTVENHINANSYKPGDVYESYSGKTVEIGNTDAEGRLILADALAYACEKLAPTRLIDFATLTGAMVIALGHEITGVMANDADLTQRLVKAGEDTFERVSSLPLIEEEKEKLKSDIADLQNIGGRDASSIKAGLFLSEFVTNVNWAHLDIAGTAYHPKGRGYIPKNGTGVGVRLMMRFLEQLGNNS